MYTLSAYALPPSVFGAEYGGAVLTDAPFSTIYINAVNSSASKTVRALIFFDIFKYCLSHNKRFVCVVAFFTRFNLLFSMRQNRFLTCLLHVLYDWRRGCCYRNCGTHLVSNFRGLAIPTPCRCDTSYFQASRRISVSSRERSFNGLLRRYSYEIFWNRVMLCGVNCCVFWFWSGVVSLVLFLVDR